MAEFILMRLSYVNDVHVSVAVEQTLQLLHRNFMLFHMVRLDWRQPLKTEPQ